MNWIQFSNKKEFSFITKCITKCSEILNVRYWWILIYFKTYSPTISLKPPLLKLSEWARRPNGRFWIIAPQLWTNHLPPSIEPMALNCHQHWICLFQFSGLPKWHQKTIRGPSISALFTNPILKQTALSLDSDILNPTFSELLPKYKSRAVSYFIKSPWFNRQSEKKKC